MKAAMLNIVFVVLTSIILLAAHFMPPFIEQNPPLQAVVPAGISLSTSHEALSLSHWFGRQYQQSLEDHLRDEPYMRTLGVRLKNQALYSLFEHNANPKTLVGKAGFLYDPNYVNAYLGLNNQSDSAFAHQIAQLRQLKSHLDTVGTPLLILLPPPKAFLFPEFLPNSYQQLQPQQSDRLKLAAALKAEGIACMDFEFYQTNREQSPAMYYPKTGLHWSHYGAYLALDSLWGTISRMLGKALPQLVLDSLRYTDKPKAPDNELAELSNIWLEYPYDTLAYPHFRIAADSNSFRPKVLAITDSYYHLWFRHHYLEGLFDKSAKEWFYNGRSFSIATPTGAPIDRSKASIQKMVSEVDILILEASATNAHRLGFGFVESYLGFLTD